MLQTSNTKCCDPQNQREYEAIIQLWASELKFSKWIYVKKQIFNVVGSLKAWDLSLDFIVSKSKIVKNERNWPKFSSKFNVTCELLFQNWPQNMNLNQI